MYGFGGITLKVQFFNFFLPIFQNFDLITLFQFLKHAVGTKVE
jgi:hypothetical protein